MSEQAKSIRMDVLFNQMPDLHATDLHLKVDESRCSASTVTRRTKNEPLTERQMVALVEELLGRERMTELHDRGSVDLGTTSRRGASGSMSSCRRATSAWPPV